MNKQQKIEAFVSEMTAFKTAIDNKCSEFVEWANKELIGMTFEDAFGGCFEEAIIVPLNSDGKIRKLILPEPDCVIEITVHLENTGPTTEEIVAAVFADRVMRE